MNASHYARNIKINYFYAIFLNLGLVRGLWMIYLAIKGFSLLQLGILEATFHIVSFLMEVPTGSVADLWGRKASRIAGRFVNIISLALMFFSDGFILQLIGFGISALGYNLESGAGDALVYDSLLCEGKQDSYMKVLGYQELITQATSVAAFLIGGYLAVHSYALAFGLSMAVSLCAALLSFGFTEPPIEQKKTEVESLTLGASILNSLKIQMVDSVKVVGKQPRITFFILFSELLFAFMICLFFYLQNFWTEQGFSEGQIGVVFAIHSLISGLTSMKAVSIERKLGQKGVLLVMPLLMVFCLWGVAVSHYPIVFYVLTGCIEGILIVTISDYLNRLIPSAHRATILSFQSMAYSLFMILLFPAVGLIGDKFSLHHAFFAMALLGSVLCVPYLVITLSKGKKDIA